MSWLARARGHYGAVGVAAAAIVASLVLAAAAAASPRGLSKGPIPEEAWGEGQIDMRLVPDFVPALGLDGGLVGWVAKDAVLPSEGVPPSDNIPVFADDLKTVVGNMIAGIGFVPAGVDPDSVRPLSTPVFWQEK